MKTEEQNWGKEKEREKFKRKVKKELMGNKTLCKWKGINKEEKFEYLFEKIEIKKETAEEIWWTEGTKEDGIIE